MALHIRPNERKIVADRISGWRAAMGTDRSNRIASQINRYRIVSLLIHISAFITIGMLLRHIPRSKLAITPARSKVVQHLVLSLPGSVEAGSPKAPPKNVAEIKANSVLHLPPRPSHPGRLSDTPQVGEGISGRSAWGKGEITIAFPKFFPHPAPDLSTMRPGTEGDVVLDALIDEQGKISQLTLMAGIGPAIDHDVIQTVRLWTFTPATKDGQPISSKQELHFHFKSSHSV
jgi:periplasmic protein TonB